MTDREYVAWNSKRKSIIKELIAIERKHGRKLVFAAMNKHMQIVRTEKNLERQRKELEAKLEKLKA